MIVRRCSHGHDIVLHKNNKPGMIKQIKLADSSMSTITYPSDSKDYFLWVDGNIIKRSDSFKTCEDEFVKQCAKEHSGGHGRIDIVKHKLINSKVVMR